MVMREEPCALEVKTPDHLPLASVVLELAVTVPWVADQLRDAPSTGDPCAFRVKYMGVL